MAESDLNRVKTICLIVCVTSSFANAQTKAPRREDRFANRILPIFRETCFQCHKDIKGQINRSGHMPISEGKLVCSQCHNPHGSIHNKLLTANRPYLCQRCHSDSRHPGTVYDGRATIAGSAPSSRLFASGCLNCHRNIHGSNHPSGKSFLR